MQVTKLDGVQGLGNVKTAIVVMEALQEQALHWALLLQDEGPDAAADWTLLKPLLIARFEQAVNEAHKYRPIAALQQRQQKNAKDFLDRCKTVWYGLLRRNRATYTIHHGRREGSAQQNKERVHKVYCLFAACTTT
jgi:hypothetical protein